MLQGLTRELMESLGEVEGRRLDREILRLSQVQFAGEENEPGMSPVP
jgi:hypothetical protein